MKIEEKDKTNEINSQLVIIERFLLLKKLLLLYPENKIRKENPNKIVPRENHVLINGFNSWLEQIII